MLQSSRPFIAKDLDVEQLKRHVESRAAVVRAVPSATWALRSDGRDKGKGLALFNSAFWSAPWVVKGGVSPAAAVGDIFAEPNKYASGCRAATALVLLKGVLDVVGPGEFDKLNNYPPPMIWDKAWPAKLLAVDKQVSGLDWVPGDRGYINGTGSSGIDAGQWVISLDGASLWGFGAEPLVQSVEEWVQTEGGPVSAQRWYPGVGLEVHYP